MSAPDPAAGAGPSRDTRHLARVVEHGRIDVVLDVGANLGQYAQRLRQGGYAGRIVSFEPLSVVHARLRELARPDPRWDIPPPVAFGDRQGEVTLLVSPESDMSSALPLSVEAAELLDSAVPTGTETVRLARLDREFDRHVRPGERVLLKIDTQGTELSVLDGAAGVLDRVAVLQIELALVPAYAGEPDWRAALARVESLGFELVLFLPGYFNRRRARLFSMDGVFVRRDAAV
ncbi:MAG TPA: FkbM family methyltransferase [Azospirillaceae bacterium]|nr:FkbM family methyltransferase [Azospirillaceae bacterium]